jgi:uncharacterized RmlC-like cupin family protein
MAEEVRIFRKSAGGSPQTTQTAGMVREALVTTPDAWVGMVRVEPGIVSGWHHHGEYDTYGYVVSGRIRFEFGPGGHGVREAGPGDVFHVPKHLVHRESNPSSEQQVLFGVRVGSGEPVINVEGPEGG